LQFSFFYFFPNSVIENGGIVGVGVVAVVVQEW
jgi:hypothetical protein